MTLLGTGLVFRFAFGGIGAAGLGLVGVIVGFSILIFPFAKNWMGAGDVKLAAAMGAWLGPALVAWSLLFGIALGGLVAAVILIRGGSGLRREVTSNLRVAAFTMTVPVAPERGSRPSKEMIPLALPFFAGAICAIVYLGGLHV